MTRACATRAVVQLYYDVLWFLIRTVGCVCVAWLVGCTPAPPCQGAYPYTEGGCVAAAAPAELPAVAASAYQFYGTHQAMPIFHYFTEGDCNFHSTITLPDGVCAWGTWYPWSNKVYLMADGWQETVVHELLHQYLNERYGDPDDNHDREEWRTTYLQALALAGIQPQGGTR